MTTATTATTGGRKDRIDATGAAVLLGFTLAMGLNQSLVKIVNAGMSPAFQAGLRSALAILPVLIYALATRKRLSIRDGSLRPGVLCGVFFSAEFLLLFQALEYTTVGRASVLFYTMPVWTTLAAHWLIPGERLTRTRAAGLALAVSGVALALLWNDGPATDRALLGDLMCILAALCWTGIALLARATALSRSRPVMQLLYQLVVSAAVLLAAAPFLGPMMREMTAGIAVVFAFQVVGVVCIGFLLWFWALSVYPASDMASWGFLTPLFGVAFGWLLLGESLSPVLLAALTLVAAGIALVNRRPKARAAAESG